MAQQPILIILAGGASSRMWPLREKSLLRFGAAPLLLSQLQRYQKLGFKQAVIVGNPGNKTLITELTAPLTQQMQLDVVVQDNPLGMGDALLRAAPVLEGKLDTPIYITQVHDVVEDQLHEEMLKAFKKNSEVTMTISDISAVN